jgi:hypothetical protein
MTPFERTLNILFARLSASENDPGFGYRIYRLPNEDQARIYRISRKKASKANANPAPPNEGCFVAMATHPELQNPCLWYCSYPTDGGESIKHAALAYDPRELSKASAHIAEFLVNGKIPKADGEYAAAA